MTAGELLALARSQLGVREEGPGNVKYNTAYYGRPMAGSYPWCAVFLWWLFRECGGSHLYYGGGKTAYCPTLLSHHRGQRVEDYRPGDVVFFDFNHNGRPDHVGLCERWEGDYITTIDGNTGDGSESNGGTVARRRRHRKYICGAYRPQYEEEFPMTEDRLRAILREEFARLEQERAALPPSPWAEEPLKGAVERGITDGSRPRSWATREEVAAMVGAARARE